MSGLAAGIRLAYFDKKVCILERHHRVGGLSSYYSRKGHDIDVGLHAMTNYVPKGVRLTPLPKLLRQLKLQPEDFDLRQQRMSVTRFPEKTLRFTNEFGFFVEEVNRNFPNQIDNFQRLVAAIREYDELALDAKPLSARQVVGFLYLRPAAGRHAVLPLDVLRERSGERHRVRAVRHHVQRHLLRGFCPSADRHTPDTWIRW